MPSPFNNKSEKATATSSEDVMVTNSNLYCERCGGLTTEGTYNSKHQRLSWNCDSCGWYNLVKDIDLD